ncbi:head GIN domain-containing protein [Flavobacterium sp.]|uniref:head GIN domain-containing protein n=1 Tax=Flavobacterium sp. TaxID=239 RepID=UPI002606B20E|nr:head GIN domain-containing protein [Flavobacterium sp.]
MKSKAYDGLTFTKLLVNKGINVVITQGDTYQVEVQTGENLINDIEVTLSGDLLTLSDNTSCNWVRDYGETTVYITAPNLTEIISKTEQNITSNGVLTYPSLRLVLMDEGDGYSGTGTGDIYLEVDNHQVVAENNELGRFFITGTTDFLSVSFYESGGVFHGENLYATDVRFYHRGSNDMYIRPLNSLDGDIFNVGDVNCYSRPPAENVHVREHYHGSLIYR